MVFPHPPRLCCDDKDAVVKCMWFVRPGTFPEGCSRGTPQHGQSVPLAFGVQDFDA